MSEIDRELIEEFVGECTEMLDLVEPEMLSAEQIDQELANKIFRPLHSMKGVAGSFDCFVMAKLAHSAETFLSLFRDQGHSSSDKRHLKAFLTSFDLLREILTALDEGRTDESFSAKAKEIIENFEALTSQLISQEFAEQNVDEIATIDLGSNDLDFADIPDKVDISDDMIDGFIAESLESLLLVETLLLTLQKGETQSGLIDEAFRSIHSFKGNCGIFSLDDFERLSHKVETILGGIKEKSVDGNNNTFNTLMQINDVLKEGIENLKSNPKGEIAGVDAYIDLLDTLIKVDDKVIQKPEEGVLNFTAPSNVKQLPKQSADKIAEKKKKLSSDLRVTTEKLDNLNDLIGELVTAQTILYENFKKLSVTESEQLDKSFHFLSRTIYDLQDVAVQIRMVPIDGVFKKMMRIVHDISTKAHKNVNLKFFGEETEIDKTLIEKISDPLTHMVRNAIDHGLEENSLREQIGKSPKGNVTIGAKHEAGEIWIYVIDDGRGLDRGKILQKAIKSGILSEEEGKELSDQDVFKLIFAPGFSTAEVVTDISGRGVGMDVVLQNVLDLKGSVSIESSLGLGTTFIIKIPLTLAILDGMLTRVGDVKYTIPIANVQEIVKVTKENVSTLFEDQELVKIRGDLIPVVFLNELHKLHQKEVTTLEGVLIVINSSGKTIALLVDELIGQHQTVVKPMSTFFSSIDGVSSCTILGNGEVSLILDVTSIVKMATEK